MMGQMDANHEMLAAIDAYAAIRRLVEKRRDIALTQLGFTNPITSSEVCRQ